MRAAVTASHALAFVLLPPRVARFQLRAYGLALRRRDRWSVRSATKPRELRMLLRLARGAVVAFHDWANPAHPGVREAIETLGLAGRGAGDLYVWCAVG